VLWSCFTFCVYWAFRVPSFKDFYSVEKMKAGTLREELDSKSWNSSRNFGSWMQILLLYWVYKPSQLLQRITPFGMYFLVSDLCLWNGDLVPFFCHTRGSQWVSRIRKRMFLITVCFMLKLLSAVANATAIVSNHPFGFLWPCVLSYCLLQLVYCI